MSLQQLSLLAGIAASLTVIISLIYVGIQVKDNARAGLFSRRVSARGSTS